MKSSYVSLNGGLGNQFFQYVFALFLRKNFGEHFVIDDSRQEKFMEHEDSRLSETGFQVPGFPVHTRIQLSEKTRRLAEHLTRRLGGPKILAKRTCSGMLASKFGSIYETAETRPIDVQEDKDLGSYTRFVGYFQSAHYFDALPPSDKAHFYNAVSKLNSHLPLQDSSFGLHLRRGDYRRRPDLGLIGVERYLELIYQEGLEASPGHLFTDEPDSDEARALSSHTKLVIARDLTPAETIAALAACKTKIIANSSLSLAAAVLSSPDSVIYAPNAKAGDSLPQDLRHRYRSDWKIF